MRDAREAIGATLIWVGLLILWFAPIVVVRSWSPGTLEAHPTLVTASIFPWGAFIVWCVAAALEADKDTT